MLKYKLLKWFACLVLVFGALAATLGIWVISDRVVQEAQRRVRYDLNSAWAVYDSHLANMETIVRLVASRTPLIDACAAGNWQDKETWNAIQGILQKHQRDFGLDFMTIVAPNGRVAVRSNSLKQVGDYRNSEPLVIEAMNGLPGSAVSSTAVLSAEQLEREAEDLSRKVFLPLQDTPLARPTALQSETRGMAMMAAAPIHKDDRLVGVVYTGLLLNRNEALVDRIERIVFGEEKYRGAAMGTVTVFLGDTRIATTVRMGNGNRAIGTRASREVADRVLDNNLSWLGRAFVVHDWCLTAYDPIDDGIRSHRAGARERKRDPGNVIGMMYVGTLEQPFRDLSRTMMWRYSGLIAVALVGALLMAMLIAGKLAKPLHRLAEGADAMRHGHQFQPVPDDRSCKETEGLIQAFNEMAETLLRRENELKEANEKLAGANESLTATNGQYMETLQFVSHELNSPLASIMNYCYMLRQRLLGGLSEKQENALEVMSANLKRVMEMIRHYLNLARIEKGEIQPVPTRVLIREDVIAPILSSLQVDISNKKLRVEDLITPKLALHADLNMTRELFENLLGNAVKYGRPGGLITLGCSTNGRLAEFAVRNEGDGIPPERRPELFQKFSRLEMNKSGKGPRGTGLGLFISKKIVESHGGTIAVDSKVGQWTEFRCTLPLAHEAAPAESRRQDEVRSPSLPKPGEHHEHKAENPVG